VLKVLFYLALFLFPFSVIFVVFNLLPHGWEFSHGVIIFLYATILFFWMAHRQGWGPALRNFFLVMGIALGVEYAGVTTGWPFGVYHYTPALGFRVMGVPAAILFAWYAAAASSLGFISCFLDSQKCLFLKAFYSALLIVSLDAVLEPTAAFVKYFWIWRAAQIPFINYASWFGIGWGLVLFLQYPKFEMGRELKYAPAAVYLMQWILFALTDLRHGFFLPVVVSFALVLGTVMLCEKESPVRR